MNYLNLREHMIMNRNKYLKFNVLNCRYKKNNKLNLINDY